MGEILPLIRKFGKNHEIVATPLKYIVDDTGQKTSVLVPVKIWEDLKNNYKKLEQKLRILNGIQQGLTEVSQARKTGRKLQTMKEFLSESIS